LITGCRIQRLTRQCRPHFQPAKACRLRCLFASCEELSANAAPREIGINEESSDARWFLFLPDDVRLVRHAVPRAIDAWSRLEEPATLTLWRLRSLEGQPNWTGLTPVQRDEGTEIFHVDGLYLCQRRTLQSLGFRCPGPPRRRDPRLSSGVGRMISRALHRERMRMYRVDRSLVTCNDGGVSIMNPEQRALHPAVAL